MNVFYSSLAIVTVLPALLCSKKINRKGKIVLWTMLVFFLVVLMAYIALFVWANMEEILD